MPIDNLMKAVIAYWPDPLPRMALADALEEAGRIEEATWWRHFPPPDDTWIFRSYGDGNVYGYGYGNGNGYGNVYGNGYGDGNGNGYGNGYGDEYEYGYGYDNGYGYGKGYGKYEQEVVKMPKVGRNQLIVLPHGWVFCGYVAEQIAPYHFRIERASNICQTGGTPWPDLAEGQGRDRATFKYWDEITVGPVFGPCRDWKGELPAPN